MSPLSSEPEARLAMMVRPKTATQKYSWGPNRSEKDARGGARKIRAITPMIPPTKEPMVAPTIANSLRPWRVSG